MRLVIREGRMCFGTGKFGQTNMDPHLISLKWNQCLQGCSSHSNWANMTPHPPTLFCFVLSCLVCFCFVFFMFFCLLVSCFGLFFYLFVLCFVFRVLFILCFILFWNVHLVRALHKMATNIHIYLLFWVLAWKIFPSQFTIET